MNTFVALIHTSSAKALGWALGYFVVEGAALALLLAAILFLLRPASARARYTTACLILLAMPAAFGVTLGLLLPRHPSMSATMQSTATVVRPPLLTSAPRISGVRPSVRERLPWLIPMWMMGVLFLYVRGVAGWIAARRMQHRGVCAVPAEWQGRLQRLSARMRVSRPVVLLESCLADTPVLVGWLRPVILLPLGCLANLPVEQLECVLLHELAHVRRHDYLVNLAQGLVEGLLFYHPAVWWVSRVVRIERENCCDDLAVEYSGNARVYAATLAVLEQRRAPQSALAASGGNLMKRIHRLLQPRPTSRTAVAPAFTAAVLLVPFAAALAAWPGKPPARPPVNLRTLLQRRTVDAIMLQSQTALQVQADGKPAYYVVTDQEREAFVALQDQVTPTDRERKAQEKAQRQALATPYRKWMNEDVAYIITDEERNAFVRLATDTEREQFIEKFWQRRDPTPNTVENEFKEEHYRRIAYANEHFGTQIAGWKTDRGRVYITYGPPDEMEDHSAGGAYQRPAAEGGGTTSTFPFQKWRYKYIEGVGNNVIIEFVDPTMSGEFHMTMDPQEKEALANVPNAGRTILRQMGIVAEPAGQAYATTRVPYTGNNTHVFRSPQDPRVVIATADNMATTEGSASAAYVIASEDVLMITVWEDPRFGGSLLVRPDGKVTLPLIGDVQAAGRTPAQLSQDINLGLAKYLTQSHTTVAVEKAHSRQSSAGVLIALEPSTARYEVTASFTTQSGRPVSSFAATTSDPMFSKWTTLAAGTYRVTVYVKNTATGVTVQSDLTVTVE